MNNSRISLWWPVRSDYDVSVPVDCWRLVLHECTQCQWSHLLLSLCCFVFQSQALRTQQLWRTKDTEQSQGMCTLFWNKIFSTKKLYYPFSKKWMHFRSQQHVLNKSPYLYGCVFNIGCRITYTMIKMQWTVSLCYALHEINPFTHHEQTLTLNEILHLDKIHL